MDWSGLPATAQAMLEEFARSGLGSWTREPWVVAAALGCAVLLLALCVALAVRVRVLRRRLDATAQPAHTLYHAIIAARESRNKAAAHQDPSGGGNQSAHQGAPQGGGRRRRGPQHPVQPAGPAAAIVPAGAAVCHVKIYIDYSNLILNWKRTDQNGVDWDQLPPVILRNLQKLTVCAGKRIVYCGANVYGSYYPARYYDLLETIENGTARSITVPFQAYKRRRMTEEAAQTVKIIGSDRAAEIERVVTERLRREMADWRRENTAEMDLLARALPNKFGYLSFPFERRTPLQLRTAHYTSDGVPIAHEKGLDVRCCTDLMADGASGLYDVAVIVSNDSDFVPAVSFVVDELGKPVIQLGPRAISDVMRAACSGHIDLEDVITQTNANRAPTTGAQVSSQPQPSPLHPRQQARPQNAAPSPLGNLAPAAPPAPALPPAPAPRQTAPVQAVPAPSEAASQPAPVQPHVQTQPHPRPLSALSDQPAVEGGASTEIPNFPVDPPKTRSE